MPNTFCNMSVHLHVLFPPLVEFWNLNLGEDNVWQLDTWSKLVLYQKTESIMRKVIINDRIIAEC